MAVTRLKRKEKRNIVKAKNKKKNIQRLNAAPVLKNIDIEKIKEEFSKKGSKPKKETQEASTEEKPKAKAKKKE